MSVLKRHIMSGDISSLINFKAISLIVLFIISVFSVPAIADDVQEEESFESIVYQLSAKSYKQKEKIIKKLSSMNDLRLPKILSEMLSGKLYYTKKNKNIIFIKEINDEYEITDVISNKIVSVVSKREIKKVKVNNKIRKILRVSLARLDLNSEQAGTRYQAVTKIMQNMDAESEKLIRQAWLIEHNAKVKSLLEAGVAILDVNNDDENVRLHALAILKTSLIPEARQAVLKLLERDDEGKYIETSYKVRKAAKSALKKIDSKIEVNQFAETLFFGISLGSVLLLSAIGLAITFGVMGVINMAHGEMMMLGAYTTYIIQQVLPEYIEYSLLMAIPAAFVVAGLFGVAIERGIIRFLYGRPLETLLATFGVSLILQQLVRTVISAQNVAVVTPEWLSGSLQINPVLSITFNRLYIIIFSIIVFLGLLFILKKTILGLQVRAVSQNRAMAKAMGVRSDWVDALTFGLGSGIAGIAGVALSQLTNVGPNLGQAYIIDSFMVVVFGGVGNLWGTFVGAMSLGVVNKFLEPWAGAVLAKILVLVFIIMFIQKKPRGLFPQKGRAAEH